MAGINVLQLHSLVSVVDFSRLIAMDKKLSSSEACLILMYKGRGARTFTVVRKARKSKLQL